MQDENIKSEVAIEFREFFSPFEFAGASTSHYFEKAYNYLKDQSSEFTLQQETIQRILKKLLLVFSQHPDYIKNWFGELFLQLQYEIFVSQSIKHIKNFSPNLEWNFYKQKQLLRFIFSNHSQSISGLEKTFEKLKSNLGYQESFENYLNYHTNDKNFLIPEFKKFSWFHLSDDMINILNDILKTDFLSKLQYNNFEHIKDILESEKQNFENGFLIDLLPDTQLEFLITYIKYFLNNPQIVQKFLDINKTK